MTLETLRTIFFSYLLVSFLLSIFYLRRRELSVGAYLLWGAFALAVPVLGPFIVILSKPGRLPIKRKQVRGRGRGRRNLSK